jgi:hypothetical protein
MFDSTCARRKWNTMVVNTEVRRSGLSRLVTISMGCIALSCGTARGDDPAGVAFFEQKVRPVLVEHCYSCHSAKAEKIKGGLVLDTRVGWQRGGDAGEPVVVPGKPDESPLILAVRHEQGLEMPPGKKLPDAVIADLVAWVSMGAPDPRVDGGGEPRRAGKSWWSLQPLGNAAPPQVEGLPEGWRVGAIDRYLGAELVEHKLAPSLPTDARTLIRRMSYNTTGLPPTPEEVDEFVTVYSANPDQAVEQLVDRLLASPRYGEQWGRHWLDVVRFGESNGFERNFLIHDLWPFRDYVIRSFNDDKPFNRLVLEHLAGDVVGAGDPDVEVGSAFLVAGPYDDVGNQDAVAAANIRAATLDDPVTTTGSAFLGLTINCARCHHHKFDPIPTEDYYRLRAAFEGVTHGRREVVRPAERERIASLAKELDEGIARLTGELEALDKGIDMRAAERAKSIPTPRPKVDPDLVDERFTAVEAKLVRLRIFSTTAKGLPRPASRPARGTVLSGESARGGRGVGNGGRLTEVEVWTSGGDSRNVALAATGARAEGAQSARANDYPEAYGPGLAIDGKPGEQWFVGEPADLTIRFPKVETIDRLTFRNSKGPGLADKAQGATPCEYDVLVSSDGEQWTLVAHGYDREAWSPAHAIAREREAVISEDERQRLATIQTQLGEMRQKRGAVPGIPQMWVGNHAQPAAPTRVQKGGDPQKPGEVVAPSSLEVLANGAKPYALAVDAPHGERRVALAQWITADDNPLTPRVLVNRLWQHHFGTGLVDTPGDFGFLGGKPSHPELLDYLARRLIQEGWRIKPIQREILLSQAYRQSSLPRDEALAIEKEARFLWRFPPRRLAAEEIRDTLLSISGKLEHRGGGPGFRLFLHSENNVSTYTPLDSHGPDTWRRAVYHHNVRAGLYDLLSDFDLPDNAFAAPRRSRTTSPLQALTLLNHAFTQDMARGLAERAVHADDVPGTIHAVYRFALQRSPTGAEVTAATELIQRFGPEAFCRAVLNFNEVLYVD